MSDTVHSRRVRPLPAFASLRARSRRPAASFILARLTPLPAVASLRARSRLPAASFIARLPSLRAVAALASLLPLALSGPRAYAAEPPPVALVNFAARQVDAAQVQAFSHNLREAFLLDDQVKMIDELTMNDALAGPEGATRLRQARSMLAEGKKAFRNHDYTTALQKLEGARAVHRTFNSEVSHPDELADLLLYQGLTLLEKNSRDLAQVTFLQMLHLSPAIDVSRAPGITPDAILLIETARKQEEGMAYKGMNATFAGEIAQKVGAVHLVTGAVQAATDPRQRGATVTVQIMAPGQRKSETTLIFELDDISSGMPQAGAGVYQKIVSVCQRALTK